MTQESITEQFDGNKQLACVGDPNAMGRIGRAYWKGKGVQKDLELAAFWMRKASEKNVKWAKYDLFDILWEINTLESLDEMITIMQSEALSGDPNAMGRIGRAYWKGKGVQKDLELAAFWMRKASEKNVKWAKYDLFSILLTIDDTSSEKELFEICSHCHDKDWAKKYLVFSYWNGVGTEQNKNKASLLASSLNADINPLHNIHTTVSDIFKFECIILHAKRNHIEPMICLCIQHGIRLSHVCVKNNVEMKSIFGIPVIKTDEIKKIDNCAIIIDDYCNVVRGESTNVKIFTLTPNNNHDDEMLLNNKQTYSTSICGTNDDIKTKVGQIIANNDLYYDYVNSNLEGQFFYIDGSNKLNFVSIKTLSHKYALGEQLFNIMLIIL